MKRIKLFVIGIVVMILMFPMLENVYARGGRSGGGWSGGRGGRGGGEYRGSGGERRSEGNRYERRDGVWECEAADAAVAGVLISEEAQPVTVIVEQSPTNDTQ